MNVMKIALTAVVAFSATTLAQPTVIATGLQGPQKFTLTPGGNFLVTETSTSPNSGRVSFVTHSGTRRSLIENLPSGTDPTGAGSGPTGIVLHDQTLYLAIGSGDAERPGSKPGTSQPNPAGESSPLFASILKFQFNGSVDTLAGTFSLTPAIQQQLADGQQVQLTDGSGEQAQVQLLADFPDSQPDPVAIYRFSNPWGMSIDDSGQTLWLADASANAVARIDTATGKWQRIARFPPRPNPTPVGPPMIDAVPTSVKPYGSYLLVSFLTGFPFIPGTAQVELLDPQKGTISPYLQWFTSVTDVAVRNADTGPQFYVLEFSQNQTAKPPAPGELIRIEPGKAPVVVAADIPAADALAIDESAGAIYILSLTGQIFQVNL